MDSFNCDDFLGSSSRSLNITPSSMTFDEEEPVYRSMAAVSIAPTYESGLGGDIFDFDGLVGISGVQFSASPPKPQLKASNSSGQRRARPLTVNDASGKLFAPILPAAFIVEPNHFHSSRSLLDIVESLRACLKTSDVEVLDFKDEKCKFKCEHFSSYSSVRFVVRVFSIENGQHLVEFQRRAGRCSGFARLYESMIVELDDIVEYSIPMSSQSFSQKTVAAVKVVNVPIVEESPVMTNDDVRSMVELVVHAKFEDQQIEMLSSLARVSAAEPGICIASGVPELASDHLGVDNVTVRRLAAAILANLAHLAVTCSILADSQLSKRIVAALTVASALEMQRECARALACLCTLGNNAATLARDGGAEKFRAILQGSTDDTVNGYLKTVLALVTVPMFSQAW